MQNEKPIHTLLLASLILYGVYALLFLVVFFAYPFIARIFPAYRYLEGPPYYSWFSMLLMFIGLGEHIALFFMARGMLRARTRQSFVPAVVFCLVLMVLFPLLFYRYTFQIEMQVMSIFYEIVHDTYPDISAFAAFRNMVGYLSPLATLSSYAGLCACALGWYRGRYLPTGGAETIHPPPAPEHHTPRPDGWEVGR